MKKLLIFLLCFTILPAFADIKIKTDTPIKWNSKVVASAAENAGLRTLLGNGGLVYNKILFNLLQRDTFSLEEAGDICYDAFYDYVLNTFGYDFIDKYSDEFWNKCNKDFVMGLVNTNNAMQFGTNVNNQTKIYTNDKLYYTVETNTVYTIDEEGIPCRYAVFESATDRIIATCMSSRNNNWNAEEKVLPGEANTTLYHVLWNENPNGSDPQSFLLFCGVRAGSDRFGVCDRLVYGGGEYKRLYGGGKGRP